MPAAAKKKVAPADTLSADAKRQFTYYLYAAVAAMDAGRYDDAWALSEFAYYLNPSDPTICSNLGFFYDHDNLTEKAMEMYKKAYEGAPNSYFSDYVIALYSDGGKKNKKKAISILKEQYKRDPYDATTINLLQQIYERESKWKEAIKAVEYYEALYTPNPYSVGQKYTYWMMMNKKKQAMQEINKYLKVDPDNPRMLVFKGSCLLNTGSVQEGMAQLDYVRKRFPDYSYTYSVLADWYSTTGDSAKYQEMLLEELHCDMEFKEKYSLLKNMAGHLKRSGLADSTYRALVNEYPLEAQAHQLLVGWLASQDSLQQAIHAAETLLDVAPDEKDSWGTMNGLYMMDTTKTSAQRREQYEKAYNHFPDDPDFAYPYITALHVDSMNEDAIVVINHMIKQKPDLSRLFTFYLIKGDIYNSMQQWDSCFAAYEKALQIDPKSAYVLNNYAWNLAESGGDLRKAERMSQQSLEGDNKNNPVYLDTYAWILHLQGQKALARFYINRARDLSLASKDEALIKEVQEHYDIIFETK